MACWWSTIRPKRAASWSSSSRSAASTASFCCRRPREDSRIKQVGRAASGYIYYVSLKGVTGATTIDLQEVGAKIPQIRSHIKLPIGVGFGIRDAQTARPWPRCPMPW